MKKCNECSQYKKCEIIKIEDCNFLKYSLKHFQHNYNREKLVEKTLLENFPAPDSSRFQIDLLTDAILHLRSRFTYTEIARILNLSRQQVYRKMLHVKKNFNNQ